MGDQIERCSAIVRVRQFDFKGVVTSHPLILTPSKAVNTAQVQIRNEFGDVLAAVIDGSQNRNWRLNDCDLGRHRWDGKSFICINLSARRMIDSHQTKLIVVIHLPEFRGNPQVIVTIAGNQLVPTDSIPLLSRLDSGSPNGIDPQPNRGAPGHRIFYKIDPPAVIGEQKRARALKTLLGSNRLINFGLEFGLQNPIGPKHPNDIDRSLLTQAEMHCGSHDALLLQQLARTHFDVTPNTERVDTLIAECLCRMRSYHLPMIGLGANVDRLGSSALSIQADQIEAAISVDVRDIEKSCQPRYGELCGGDPAQRVTQPNSHIAAVRQGCPRTNPCNNEIVDPVVVQVGHPNP